MLCEIVLTHCGVTDDCQVGHDDDCFPNTAVMTSCMSWSVTAGSTYLIQVDGFGGAAGLVSLHVAAPVITPANDNFAK